MRRGRFRRSCRIRVRAPGRRSGAFNESLSATVGLACVAHLQIGTDIGDNGTKLQDAHDHYQPPRSR